MTELATVMARAPLDGLRTAAPNAVRTVTTGRGRYRISATRVGGAPLTGVAVAVLVGPGFEEPRSDAELRTMYSLTAREIQVARLLASGRSNKQIADELGIGGSTARRHTEAVLRKIDVAFRLQVKGRVSRDGARAPDGG